MPAVRQLLCIPLALDALPPANSTHEIYVAKGRFGSSTARCEMQQSDFCPTISLNRATARFYTIRTPSIFSSFIQPWRRTRFHEKQFIALKQQRALLCLGSMRSLYA